MLKIATVMDEEYSASFLMKAGFLKLVQHTKTVKMFVSRLELLPS